MLQQQGSSPGAPGPPGSGSASAGASPAPWTRERIEAFLRRERPRYQRIERPFGLSTEGEDRRADVPVLFPFDLQGKSVLDVGCQVGFFCHEAVRRGAARVVGVDHDADAIRQARALAECVGLGGAIEYRDLDLETDPLPEGRFDVVLCLRVVHHLRDPLAAIQRLAAVAREALVLEVRAPHSKRSLAMLKDLGFSWLARRRLGELPVVLVGRNGTLGAKEYKFYISRGALEHLLLRHRNHFARIDFGRSSAEDVVAVAYRRRIRELRVLAGPTGAGKRTLCGRLLEKEERPDLREAIGWGTGGWVGADPRAVAASTETRVDKLVLRYDLLRPWKAYIAGAKVYSRDEALDLLECADEARVATLFVEPHELLGRERERTARRRPGRVLGLYEHGPRVASVYRAWLDFLDARRLESAFIDSTAEPRSITRAELEARLDAVARSSEPS